MTESETIHTLHSPAWQLLAELAPPTGPGSEHRAADWVAGAVRELRLGPAPVRRIQEAVTEGWRKVINRENQDQDNLPLLIRIWISAAHPEDPSSSNLGAQLGDRQECCGWGFFLIQKQADDSEASAGEAHHVIELFLYQESGHSRK